MSKIRVLNEDGAEKRIIVPRSGDAGFDVVANSSPNIVGAYYIYRGKTYYSSVDYIEYRTGIHIQPEDEDTFALAFPRSSISKTKLVLSNSVGAIDNSYTGEILFRFRYLFSPRDLICIDNKFFFEIDESKIYQKGDKIGQLIFTKKQDCSLQFVESLQETERNDGGFGSTGK